MSKMSEWVKRKTVRQDHFFVRPIPPNSHWNKRDGVEARGEYNRGLTPSTSVPTTNGSYLPAAEQDGNILSRPPIHSENGSGENGLNGDYVGVEVGRRLPVCQISVSSSRRSSSSSSRPGVARRSIVDQCFKPREREEYLRLLQQHTTVDLGYHSNQRTSSRSSGSRPSGRNAGSFLPLPLAPPSSSSSSVGARPSSHRATPRPRLTPNRTRTPVVLPSERLSQRTEASMAAADTFLRPHTLSRDYHQRITLPPGRGQPQRRSSQSEAEREDRLSPVENHDVIVVEDDKDFRKSTSPASSYKFKTSEYLDEDWIGKVNHKYASAEQERQQLIKEAEIRKKLLEERREARLGNLDKKLREQMRLFDDEPEVIEELPLPEVPQEKPLPELTDEMQREINAAFDNGPSSQVLSVGFRLQLTRADIATLRGLNWLNDEVINFYMNMLMERGEGQGYSRVYAFNTFFYPKLIDGGHTAVKRWTRKTDVFSFQYLIIPVHLGVHWCLCVVYMKEKRICYYDSMGGNNNQCLNAVRQYLYDESVQKRNQPLDMSTWSLETVKDIPQQMNGSDCGMFSCMYAESLTRGANITFSQKDMPYFRRRMVYEILKKKLL